MGIWCVQFRSGGLGHHEETDSPGRYGETARYGPTPTAFEPHQ